MSVVALDGISYETADVHDLNILHEQLNNLLKNVSDERLSLWTHVIRRRETVYPDGTFTSPFAAELDAKYRDKMVS